MFDYRLDDEQLIGLRTRFEKVYIRQIPMPVGKTSKMVRWALIALVIASVIVSASHTIPAFLDTIEGGIADWLKLVIALAALVMVEVGMLVLAYVLSRRLADVDAGHINTQLKRGLGLAFVLALLANLHSTLAPRFGETEHWDKFSFLVFVLMGVSAPTLAYIAGEVFGLTTLKDERDNADAMSDWHTKREVAWEAALAKYQRDMVKVARPVSGVDPALSARPSAELSAGQADTDKSGHGTGQGYTKRTDAREQVRRWLTENPDDLALNVRDLAGKIGVGKSTVAEVKSAMLSERSDAPPTSSIE